MPDEPVTCLVAQDHFVHQSLGRRDRRSAQAPRHQRGFCGDRLGHRRRAPGPENAARPRRLAHVPHLVCRRGLDKSDHTSRFAPMATTRGSAGRTVRRSRRRSPPGSTRSHLEEEQPIMHRLNKAALDNVVYAPPGFLLSYQAWRKNVTGVAPRAAAVLLGRQQNRINLLASRHADLRRPPHRRDHPGDGGGGAVRVQPALHRPRRSRRRDRRRPGDAGRRGAHPGRASASTGRSWSASASGSGRSCTAISASRSSPTCRSPP